jgi:hypothetical protein
MANPFPFVAGDVLTAAEMNGIGETTAYTPTFTNITVGNGTVDFKYVQIQKLVLVQGTLTFGSTTSISGSPNITFPVNSVTYPGGTPVGMVRVFTPGNAYFGFTQPISATQIAIRLFNVSGIYLQVGGFDATTPWTWATGDSISVQFVYEAA